MPITPESLDLKEVSVEIEIPQALLDRFIQSFAAPDTFTGSLGAFRLGRRLTSFRRPRGEHGASPPKPAETLHFISS